MELFNQAKTNCKNSTVQLFKSLFLGLLCACILSCTTYIPPPPPPPTALDYAKELRAQGVGVFQTGETITLILPSDIVFNPDSANFSPDAPNVLYPLVQLLQFYEIIGLRVIAYTDDSSSPQRAKALTARQAQRMVAYLSAQPSMDVRLIYAFSYGSNNPVASNETGEGQAQNRRIEIRYRYQTLAPIV